MKCKAFTSVKEENPNGGEAAATSAGGPSTTTAHNIRRKSQNATDKKYSVIQCTGYLKSWAPAKIGLEDQEVDGDVGDPLSCLVAIGRVPPDIFATKASTPRSSSFLNVASVQFMSRHAIDGKFLFVDQRQELCENCSLGNSFISIFIILQSNAGVGIPTARAARYQHVRVLSQRRRSRNGRIAQRSPSNNIQGHNSSIWVSHQREWFRTATK